jgi:hypothetical protein
LLLGMEHSPFQDEVGLQGLVCLKSRIQPGDRFRGGNSE